MKSWACLMGTYPWNKQAMEKKKPVDTEKGLYSLKNISTGIILLKYPEWIMEEGGSLAPQFPFYSNHYWGYSQCILGVIDNYTHQLPTYDAKPLCGGTLDNTLWEQIFPSLISDTYSSIIVSRLLQNSLPKTMCFHWVCHDHAADAFVFQQIENPAYRSPYTQFMLQKTMMNCRIRQQNSCNHALTLY